MRRRALSALCRFTFTLGNSAALPHFGFVPEADIRSAAAGLDHMSSQVIDGTLPKIRDQASLPNPPCQPPAEIEPPHRTQTW